MAANPQSSIGDPNFQFLPHPNIMRKGQFDSGLLSCCDDGKLCCYGYFCVCCLIADNGSRMDGFSKPCFFCCYPGHPWKNRLQAKSLFGIQSSCFGDCLTTLLCGVCSEIQIAKQLRLYDKQPDGPQRGTTQSGGAFYLPPTRETMDGQPNPMKPNQWSSGLCDCFQDSSNCCFTWCCPACAVASNAAKMENDSACCGCIYPGGSWKNRLQIQSLRGIPASPLKDCCISVFCCYCSECQVGRELKILNMAGMGQPQQQMMMVPQGQAMYAQQPMQGGQPMYAQQQQPMYAQQPMASAPPPQQYAPQQPMTTANAPLA